MSQRLRRDSTQVPEAGPSTSRRVSRVVTEGDSDNEEQRRPRNSKASSSKRIIEEQDDEEDVEAGNDDEDPEQSGDQDVDEVFGELAHPLPKLQVDEEFQNQPWKRDEAVVKVGNAMKEWREVQRLLKHSMEILASSTTDLQDALSSGNPDEEASLEIKKADLDFRKMLDKMYEAVIREKALESLRAQLESDNPPPNLQEEMEASVKSKLDARNALTSRKRYLEDENYGFFRGSVWEAQGNGQGVPNMKTFIDREEGDSDSEDEDIELQAVAQNYKDPISFGWLEKPVRSKVCKHVYSRATITELIKSSTSRTHAGCPVSGCSKVISLADLEDDPQLEQRVQQAKRREEQNDNRGGQNNYQDIDDDDDSEDEEVEN